MNRKFPKIAKLVMWAFLLFLIISALAVHIRQFNRSSIENEITKMISGEVFSEVQYESFEDQLILYSKKNISKAALGTVYNRLAYMCSQNGDWLGYYSNFGKAVYYLEESGNYNDEINLYLDLVYYVYFAGGNFDLAKTAMDKVDALVVQNKNTDIQMLSLYHKINALLALYTGDRVRALEEAYNARNVITDMNAVYAESFIQAADMIIARIRLEEGDHTYAEQLVESLKDSPSFEYDDFSMINTNFTIPYYQLKASVSAHNGDEAEVRSCLEQILQRSYKFDYQYAVTDILSLIKQNYTLSDELLSWINTQELEAYALFVEKKSDFYSAICSALVETNLEDARSHEMEQIRYMKSGHLIVILILFLFGLIVFVFHMWKRIYTDPLTGIGNRRAFDRAIRRNKKHMTDFSVIMIDIDNFKNVNDTFGHAEGDVVLSVLGSILLERKEARKIMPFRYGGEEFAILISGDYVPVGREIAESLRYQIECHKWDKDLFITISAGFAPTVEEADKNLYIAKKNGKNQVV